MWRAGLPREHNEAREERAIARTIAQLVSLNSDLCAVTRTSLPVELPTKRIPSDGRAIIQNLEGLDLACARKLIPLLNL
jgi:hypothetical protein